MRRATSCSVDWSHAYASSTWEKSTDRPLVPPPSLPPGLPLALPLQDPDVLAVLGNRGDQQGLHPVELHMHVKAPTEQGVRTGATKKWSA